MARVTYNQDFNTVSIYDNNKGFTFRKENLIRVYQYITNHSTVVHLLDTNNWEVDISLNNDTIDFFNEHAHFVVPVQDIEELLKDS